MSIAKTTRPHLLTREAAAARIEALEAALRVCVQYHVIAAADCRAISAVNRDNPLGVEMLTLAIDHDMAAEDIGEIARAALAPPADRVLLLRKYADRIEALEAALRRIDAINDSPACFHKDINDVCRVVLGPE